MNIISRIFNKRWVVLLAVFLVSLSAAIYLHWPALTEYTIYKSDLKQEPHIFAYHTTTFRDEDIILMYSHFNESPVQNFLMYVGTFLLDGVTLSKVIAVVFYGLAAVYTCVLGWSMFGRRGGILCAVFFTFFPDNFEYFAGGFSKLWAIPLLFSLIYILEKEKWSYLLFLLPFAALAYPVITVLIGLTVLVFLLLLAANDRVQARRLFLFLAGGSAVALGILLFKYGTPPPEIGRMVPGEVLRRMPEMKKGGLAIDNFLPVMPVYRAIMRHIDPFIYLTTIIFLVVLGFRRVAWRRSWTALLIASIIGYVLADYFILRLYFPNRYTRYSMAVLLVLWNASNWDLFLRKIKSSWLQGLVIVFVLVVAGVYYADNFKQGKDTQNYSRYYNLCRYIQTLPPKTLFAGPPRVIDNIPIMGKRSILCVYKMAHPWFDNYYREVKKRTIDTYRALYAEDVAEINRLYELYGVDYLVIEKRLYSGKYRRRKRIYVEPFNTMIKKMIRGRENFLLEEPPEDSILYEDKRFILIRLPLHAVEGKVIDQ